MGPIFLLGGGGRTGSTLVQRLLLSTRQVLLWGEHGGALVPPLHHIVRKMQVWVARESDSQAQRTQFLEVGANTWVPNMGPEPGVFRSACKAFLDHALAQPAREIGYARWGFKEIRYGREAALFLQDLYPDACFILLLRDPLACLRSIKSTGWYGKDFQANPLLFLRTWAQLSWQLTQVRPLLKRSCLLRYEDLLADPESAIRKMAGVCDIAEPLFDRAILRHVERGSPRAPAALEEGDRLALADPPFRRVAEQLGYAPNDSAEPDLSIGQDRRGKPGGSP